MENQFIPRVYPRFWFCLNEKVKKIFLYREQPWVWVFMTISSLDQAFKAVHANAVHT